MPRISLHKDELLSTRHTVLVDVLQPLRGNRQIWPTFQPAHGALAIAAWDPFSAGSTYRDSRFPSYASDVWCQYFELWCPYNGDRLYSLDRAYLTLFATDRPTQRAVKLVCVHCDPDDASTDPVGNFKRGPHLHFEQAQDDRLKGCHFPLNYGHLTQVLSSAKSLTEAIKDAAFILSCEVVARFDSQRGR